MHCAIYVHILLYLFTYLLLLAPTPLVNDVVGFGAEEKAKTGAIPSPYKFHLVGKKILLRKISSKIQNLDLQIFPFGRFRGKIKILSTSGSSTTSEICSCLSES